MAWRWRSGGYTMSPKNDRINARIRAHALLACRYLLGTDSPIPIAGRKLLAGISASAINEFAATPQNWALIARATSNLRWSNRDTNFWHRFADTAIGCERTPSEGGHSNRQMPTFPAPDDDLRQILGQGLIGELLVCQDAEAIWNTAVGQIAEANLDAWRDLVGSVGAFVCFRGAHGVVNACSTADYPGLIAINANVPSVVVWEQLFHEAAHAKFDQFLSASARTAALLNSLPALPSPFTESVRPAHRVAHGILAYSAVLELWQSLPETEPPDVTVGDWSKCRQDRIAEVLRRVEFAERALVGCLDQTEVEQWSEIKRFVLPFCKSLACEATCAASDRTILAVGTSLVQIGLPPIEQAEIVLAIANYKVSRISCAPKVGYLLAQILPSSSGVCFGRHQVVSHGDGALGGFSNIATAFPNFDSAPADAEVYCYVAATPRLAREAQQLDERNDAGHLFGIPRCCMDAFQANWLNAVSNFGGDMAAATATTGQLHTVPKDWRCDATAMYRGGGVTWHFPCGPACSATISIVESRIEQLSAIDAQLCAKLMAAYRR